MKYLHKALVALLVSTAALPAVAQEIRTSYFMETSKFRHQMNPALIDDRPFVSFPFLGNINIGANGQFGGNTFVFDIDPTQNGGRTQGTFLHPEVSNEMFFDKLGKGDLTGGVYLNTNIFSVGFRGFKGGNVVELNVRSNTDFNLPNQLFHLAKEGFANEQYSFKDLGFRNQTYAELALGHSHQLNRNFTIGAKAKILVGLGYANLHIPQLDLTLNDQQWAVRGRAEAAAALMKTRIKVDEDGKLDELDAFKGGTTGMGVAFDLGAVYKVHGMENLKFSASLTDLGAINHSDAQHFANKKDSWSFDGFEKAYVMSDRDNAQELGEEFERMGDELKEMANLYETSEKGKSQSLAATLNIGAEYVLPDYDKLSFGLLYTNRMNGVYSWRSTMLSARIRPLKALEVGVSTAFTSTGTCFGTMLSLGNKGFRFFVAADQFVGSLSKQGIPINSLNSNIAFGIGFPL